MKLRSDLIHPDVLQDYLNSAYLSFTDEQHRLVDIKLFHQLFIYKYANQLSNYNFWVEFKQRTHELHCDSICGMKFVFPLKK